MKKRGLIRIQLTLLVVLALLVIVRMIVGPPAPSGLVVFVDLEAQTLRHAAFELEQPAEVAILATGSFEQQGASSTLAAYSWIVRRADAETVWEMDPRTAEAGRGNAAHVPGDTFDLEAGIYDVYFASYGQEQRQNRRQRWRNDADQWEFVLRLTDETIPARRLSDRIDTITKEAENVVWTSAPMRSNREQEHLFEIKQPTQLRLYAVGEIKGQSGDQYWIENAGTGEHVWEMKQENTKPAGGLATNRRFRGELTLAPGAYRVAAQTNRDHAFYDWEGNPPYDPSAWGLTLYAEDPYAITAFDPWTSRQPLVSLTRVPDDTKLSRRFEVQQPIQVVLYSVGEMTDRNSIYDFGELFKEETNRKRSIWKMKWNASQQAGGGDKNRLEVAFIRLEPGVYTLQYQTDGSHAYDDWNTGAPDYPERWGVTLFPMAPALDEGVFQLLPSLSGDDWPTPNPPISGLDVNEGAVLLDWTQLRGDEEKSHPFELQDEARLYILALGEITSSSQYDYGWIERAGTNDVVWEMMLDNTHPAGGADRNRRFEGIVTLPPGGYVVNYKTDSSHHYGFFGDEGPDEPAAWGITIHFVADEEAPPDPEQ
ncbi:MAG: hypothetical protein ACE5G0_19525 [Rhodothermales bacterium]